MIEVRSLTKRYGDLTAVEDLSFDVRGGEIVGLVGPNGAGKTTTLRCVTGIIPATSGTMADGGERGDALIERLEIAEQARRAACGALAWHAPESGHRVLLHRPRALLFDEPLTGLDPAGIRRMKTTIRQVAGDGTAVVLSSHLLQLVEELASRILVLAHGHIVAFGSVAELAASRPELAGKGLEDVSHMVLAFKPPEVQFLFQGPIARRTLLNYKLLRAQTGILLMAVLFTLMFRTLLPLPWPVVTASFWLVLATAAAAVLVDSLVLLAFRIGSAQTGDEMLHMVNAALSRTAPAVVLLPFRILVAPLREEES